MRKFLLDDVVVRWCGVTERLRRWRRTITITALLSLMVGVGWSARSLSFDPRSLDPVAFACILLLLPPSLWLNAAELRLCALATGNAMTSRDALEASNIATIANILPLPGGALVRGAALVRAGADRMASTTVVIAAALLWLALAIAISSIIALPPVLGLPLGSVAVLAAVVIVARIAWVSNATVALGFLAVRIGLLALTIGRIHYCFGALGLVVGPHEAAVYAVASVVATFVGVVPAGLGVTEGVAAALALAVHASPAAAFLALGLNRVIGLVGSGLVVCWFAGFAGRRVVR